MNMANLSTDKPINIAIIAMGGQGGGVLSKWILDLAGSQDYIAQYTSVPGVAQRTGATIYYIELFSTHLAEQAGKKPILALTPVPGDVDIVIASEMVEAGRALMRGFVSENTSFIASNHRDYAIAEKQEMGDGRQPVDEINRLAEETAREFICFDMDAAARSVGSVISSVLFGALAGANALPFKRADFEATIATTNKAVQANLKGFELGFEAATNRRANDKQATKPSATKISEPRQKHAAGSKLLTRMEKEFPPHAHFYIREGLKKLVDFEGTQYANLYLDRLAQIYAADKQAGGGDKEWQLTKATARYLALAMAYDDVIRVADLKTRSDRFNRFRNEVKAEPSQIVHVSEFMHPRLEEMAEVLPVKLGQLALSSKAVRKISGLFFNKGRRVSTTKLGGFLLLSMMSRMAWLRKYSLRLSRETHRIESWLSEINTAAQEDYSLAVEVAGLQRLVKGYGDTHARGLHRYSVIMDVYSEIKGSAGAGDTIANLKMAALKDEEGTAFAHALGTLDGKPTSSSTSTPVPPLIAAQPIQ